MEVERWVQEERSLPASASFESAQFYAVGRIGCQIKSQERIWTSGSHMETDTSLDFFVFCLASRMISSLHFGLVSPYP